MPESSAPVSLEVRRPKIALVPPSPSSEPTRGGIPRFWWGDDPFRTHFLDALSSTFPFGEAFFVRSVRHYSQKVSSQTVSDSDSPDAAAAGLAARIRSFAGQEGQHSRIHEEHVELLLRQGYGALAVRNRIADRVVRWHNRRLPALSLAVTAALEHLTAILARQVLRDPDRWLADMHPEMRKLWRWHALEEAEHKSVAFDVLSQVAPSRALRSYALGISTIGIALETLDRMVYMLWKDGRLFDWKGWQSGLRFLFGRGGFLRGVGEDYRAWYRRDFHPDTIDDRALIARVAPEVELEIAS